MTSEQLFRDLKNIQKYEEWKSFVEHIQTLIQIHKESSINYTTKAKLDDAQRQAWIAEGLLEAIEEPESVVKSNESVIGLYVQKVCHFCGNLFKAA